MHGQSLERFAAARAYMGAFDRGGADTRLESGYFTSSTSSTMNVFAQVAERFQNHALVELGGAGSWNGERKGRMRLSVGE